MFTRTEQLIGREALMRLNRAKVLLIGVGGVGGWCAEALVRTGIQHLTIVDFDDVALSNLNRQIVAVSGNIGKPKAQEMRQRLLSVNPEAEIIAINGKYTLDGIIQLTDRDSSIQLDFNDYDYVLDAIDSVSCKAQLLYEATLSSATLFSAMGAGRKLNPLTVRTAEFAKVAGCPLARAVRHRMKHTALYPQKKFVCVYSDEQSGTAGTIAPVVGTFGFTLASLVINDIIQNLPKQ